MKALVLVAATLAIGSALPRSCPPGEVFTTCGKACESTCDRPNFPCLTMICMSGCVCQQGTHRHLDSGECRELEDCQRDVVKPVAPIACANPNEEYKSCGPMSEATCARPNPIFISLRCRPGCFCVDGYIRDAEGQCVKKEECGKACASDEVFSQCVPVTQPSCNNPAPIMMSLRCFPGCTCPHAHYRNDPGRCVTSLLCGNEKKCLRDRAESSGLPGAFTPTCHNDGSYAAKQCHSSTGYCWCVDPEGKEVLGSRRGPAEGEVAC